MQLASNGAKFEIQMWRTTCNMHRKQHCIH
jgi:hypothetical protein